MCVVLELLGEEGTKYDVVHIYPIFSRHPRGPCFAGTDDGCSCAACALAKECAYTLTAGYNAASFMRVWLGCHNVLIDRSINRKIMVSGNAAGRH
jgi:hypothetical protein